MRAVRGLWTGLGGCAGGSPSGLLFGLLSCLLFGLLLSACQLPAPEEPGDPAGSDAAAEALRPDPALFSGSRAWEHLVALEKIGPRVSGQKGAKRARDYLREELGSLGLEVRERRVVVAQAGADEALELVHLVAVLPGDSPDVFLLAAHYDTRHHESFRYVGTNESASGAALLLELARVMKLAPRPYTIWFAFIDGDALHGEDDAGTAGLLGSRSFASSLAADGELEGLRLAVVFDAVADSDLHIARDLNSQRVYREAFWEAAHDLDHSSAFAADQVLESPEVAHRSFEEQGVRGIVAIVDNRYGGDVIPGTYWHTEYDTGSQCSPDSLQTVGEVSLEALTRIAQRLSKIDRFASHPLESVGQAPDTAPLRLQTGHQAPPDALR
jgi:glutaminyl-peptide cyclotransferase